MKKKRKKLRLQNYDYSQNGMYFVTICTHNKKCFFGRVEDNKMKLNLAGKIIDKWWIELENKFDIISHEYVIMPNHIHGIIEINNNACDNVVADLCVSQNAKKEEHVQQGQTHRSVPTISTMIQWFKTMTTNEYIKNVKMGKLPPFDKKIWQRSYYDHIIRKEESLQKIQEYIIINPSEWQKDELYKAL